MPSAIDKMTGWVADRYNFASTKFRTPDKAPPYIRTEIVDNPGIPENTWGKWSEERKAKVAATIPWIYSNIFRIQNEIAGANLKIVDKDTGESVESDLAALLDKPNEFFDGMALLSYTIWGMYLGMWGGAWYLAPDKNNPNVIKEIWPIPIDRFEPVKHKTKFISAYKYTSKKGKSILINPNYVVRFFFPHPWDMWDNFSPLVASTLEMSTYISLATNTRDLFAKGRGVPLAVVSVSADITKEDFAVVRQQLREDWESERRIAIARAGDISTTTVGLSNRDLEIVSLANTNRDTIDATYMGGIPWRSDQFKSGEGLREANKQIKEVVIHPLHKRIENIIYINLQDPFFNPAHKVKFDDIRAQDRSILVQERTIYWRRSTLNEARREMGDQALEIPTGSPLPDWYGSLPVSLANSPQVFLAITGLNQPLLGAGGGGGGKEEPLKDTVGNLPGQLDTGAAVNATASGGDPVAANIKEAAAVGMRVEIKRWRTVLLKKWRKAPDAKALMGVSFESNIIMDTVRESIESKLPDVKSEQDIYDIFKMWSE